MLNKNKCGKVPWREETKDLQYQFQKWKDTPIILNILFNFYFSKVDLIIPE